MYLNTWDLTTMPKDQIPLQQGVYGQELLLPILCTCCSFWANLQYLVEHATAFQAEEDGL